jgi:hypothetical protein
MRREAECRMRDLMRDGGRVPILSSCPAHGARVAFPGRKTGARQALVLRELADDSLFLAARDVDKDGHARGLETRQEVLTQSPVLARALTAGPWR